MNKLLYLMIIWKIICIQLCFSKNITAVSCSYSDVNAIFANVSSGDTIYLPSDTVTWRNELKISKGVSIIGAGIGKTCIKWVGGTSASIFSYNPINPHLNEKFRISGLTIDANSIVDVNCISIVNTNTKSFISNVRIDHNEIIGATGNAGYAIFIQGSIYGLIDNNRINHNFRIFRLLGDNDNSWNDPIKSGSKNFLYIENNDISTYGDLIISSGWGTRWVLRYNVVDLSNRDFNIIDAHGNLSSVRGNVGHEIYENVFKNASDRNDGMRWHDLRGGTALVYNNKVYGNEQTCVLMVHEEDCDNIDQNIDCEYPGIDPICNTYIWNNLYNDKKMQIDNGTSNINTMMIKEDRDWWDDYGVDDTNFKYGKENERNQDCVENDCYWDSDNKILYRCTGNKIWKKVYEPLSYPHPLYSPPPVNSIRIK